MLCMEGKWAHYSNDYLVSVVFEKYIVRNVMLRFLLFSFLNRTLMEPFVVYLCN